eukprot:s2100_g6.t1
MEERSWCPIRERSGLRNPMTAVTISLSLPCGCDMSDTVLNSNSNLLESAEPVPKARKERNRLVLLETDFSTGEEADPWESEGSDVELFHSSFVRGGKRRSSNKLERRRESSSKTEVLAKQRILRRLHVRYDFEDIFQRVLAEEQAVNFFTCEGHKPEPGPAKKKTKKSKQAEEKKDDRQIRFRNYIPRTPELRDFCMPKITSADIEAEIDKEIQEAIAAAEARKDVFLFVRQARRDRSVFGSRPHIACFLVEWLRRRRKEEAAGLDGEALSARDCSAVGENFVDPHCPLCLLPCGSDAEGLPVLVHCLVVGEVQGKLLVCLPAASWHRKVAKRTIPRGFLSKVFGAEVVVAALSDRATEAAGQTARVWLGLCEGSTESTIQVSDEDTTVPFGALPAGELVVPLVDALVDLCAAWRRRLDPYAHRHRRLWPRCKMVTPGPLTRLKAEPATAQQQPRLQTPLDESDEEADVQEALRPKASVQDVPPVPQPTDPAEAFAQAMVRLSGTQLPVCPETVRIGVPLNRKQWQLVRSLERIVFGSFFPLTFEPEDYGRIGHKVEGQANTLRALGRAAAVLSQSFAGYAPRSFSFGVTTAQQGPFPVEVAGTLPGKADVAAMPIVADRVKLPATPAFEPSPFMDRTTSEFFNYPLHQARVPDPVSERPLFVKILADSKQKLLLLQALARSGRLEPLASVPAPRSEWGAGFFCVAKDGLRGRLVLDARPANELEDFPGHWVHALASAACLSGLVLRPGQVLVMSGTDLQDCFISSKLRPSESCATTRPVGSRFKKPSLSLIGLVRPLLAAVSLCFAGSLRSLWAIRPPVSSPSAAT